MQLFKWNLVEIYSKLEEKAKTFFSASIFPHYTYIYIICIYKYITAQTTDSSPSWDPAVSPLKLLPFIIHSICNLFTSRSLSCQRSWIFIPSGIWFNSNYLDSNPKATRRCPPEWRGLASTASWDSFWVDVKLENLVWSPELRKPRNIHTIFCKLVY